MFSLNEEKDHKYKAEIIKHRKKTNFNAIAMISKEIQHISLPHPACQGW